MFLTKIAPTFDRNKRECLVHKVVMPISVILFLITFVNADYWSNRIQMIDSDFSQSVGASIILTNKEKQVNEILIKKKLKEYDEGFQDPSKFLPAEHFFKAKKHIEESAIFKFIQKLPKGASLHSHDTALVSFEYLFNLTYRKDLYGCVINDRLKLHFFDGKVNKDCDWRKIEDLRKENSTFDDYLKSQLSIIVDDPVKAYPTINVVWNRFQATFSTIKGLIEYRPVFQDYLYQALLEFYKDNVMYLELRSSLPDLYELNGTIYDTPKVARLYLEIVERFKIDYPEFHGVRLIYAKSRNVDNVTVKKYVATVTALKQQYPDFIAGFDLEGQEDLGRPLVDFVPQLLELAETGTKFFFHAAETDWYGTTTDMNLVDAILLNTTRIGHGYGILKHPKILEEVKNRNLAIEISPLSNQVLKLVDDLRNHPAAFLIASGFPVVITCDDPSFWGAKGLSYDWYEAFLGFASRESDLRLLKQLAINSLKHSAMSDVERNIVFSKWKALWDRFLNDVKHL